MSYGHCIVYPISGQLLVHENIIEPQFLMLRTSFEAQVFSIHEIGFEHALVWSGHSKNWNQHA